MAYSLPEWCRPVWEPLQRGLQALANELFRYDIWNVGVVRKTITTIDDLAELPEPVWLPPAPPLTYIADPFLVVRGGREAILAELYSHHRGGRGQIVRVFLDDRSDALHYETVIDTPTHLSYPFPMHFGDEDYCIPETYRSGACVRYRLTPSGRFVFDRVLIDGIAAVDPTLVFHGGLWWLFCTDHQRGNNSLLLAFYSETPDGIWTPHPLNPIKCNLVGSRPAGPFFHLNDRLYRPAQDCSLTYGGAVVIHEVLALTPTAFDERPVITIRPDRSWPYPDGVHHLVVERDCVILDAKRTRYDWAYRLRRLI